MRQHKGRAVYQYTKDGDLVKEHPSARSLDREFGMADDSFRKNIDSGKPYKGYYWSYIQETPKVISEEDVAEEYPYKVIEGEYIWRSKRGTIRLSVDDADKMFQDYSAKGYNLTQSQMIRKYNLEPYEWHSIKNTLMMYKASNIFSPYTMDNTPPEDMEKMMERKFSELHQNRGSIIEKTYHRSLQKNYRKAIDTYHKKAYDHESMMVGLMDMLPSLEPVSIREAPSTGDMQELNVCIADLHTGAGVRNMQITPNFSLSELEYKLLRLAQAVNKHKAARVNLFFLGDNIESFSGLNHDDTWQDMEENLHGANVVFSAYKLILNFISKVNNVTYVGGIGSNHDRASAKKSQDQKGEMGKLIFLLLQEQLKGHIQVEYEDYVLTHSSGNVRFIVTHGHHNNIKKPLKMALDYGDTSMFNLILAGHLHSRITDHDSHNIRRVYCPSIFTGNNYAERNGFTSSSGALLISDMGMAAPRIIDEPL